MSPGSSSTGAASQHQPGRIQAYACLEFDNFTFYIQTLSVTVGRRPPAIQVLDPSGAPLDSEQHVKQEPSDAEPKQFGHDLSPKLAPQLSDSRSTSPGRATSSSNGVHHNQAEPGQLRPAVPEEESETQAELEHHRSRQKKAKEQAANVDVDLGNIKAVSRDHARLYFDHDLGSWALTVHGRNGVVVEGRWKAKGETVPLRKRTRIQIAERIFYFILPSTIVQQDGQLAPAPMQDASSSSDGEVQVDSDDLESDSEPEKPLAAVASTTKQSKAKAKARAAVAEPFAIPQEDYHLYAARNPPRRSTAKAARYIEQDEDSPPPSPQQQQQPRASSSKASAPPPDTEHDFPDDELAASASMEPEYDIDPVGSTSSRVKLTVKTKESQAAATNTSRKGRGAAQKSKAAASAAQQAAQQQQQHQQQQQKEQQQQQKENSKKKGSQAPSQSPAQGSTATSKSGKPVQPKISQLTVQPVAQMEEWFGRPEKPPFSFASLVAQAITQNAPFKLTSAAICEWIAWKYPWFEANKEKVAWQNSVQQNLTVHTIFLKIPRQSDEPGKGNFWLMDPAQAHTFDGHNFTSQPIKAGSAVAQGHDVYAAKERAKAANRRAMDDWNDRKDAGEDVGPHGGLPGVGMNPPGPTAPITPMPRPEPKPEPAEPEVIEPEPEFAEPVKPVASASPQAAPSQTSVSPAPQSSHASPSVPSPAPAPVHHSPAPPPAKRSAGGKAAAAPAKATSKGPMPAAVSPSASTHLSPVASTSKASLPPPAAPPLPQQSASPQLSSSTATPAAAPTPTPTTAQSGTAAFIPIEIGPIPESYVRPVPPPDAPPPKDELSAQLLREPPVILHENKLILSPTIFAHLKPTQIQELSKLGASKAIGILQAYIVKHFKEKAKKAQAAKKAGASPSPSPAPPAASLPASASPTGNNSANASNNSNGAVAESNPRKRPAAGGEPPAKRAAAS